MTERPGISIFDTDTVNTAGNTAGGSSATPSFPLSRRGYDPSSVDRRIAQLTSERATLAANLEEVRRHTAELEAELATLRERTSSTHAPTYAELGGRASELL